MLGHDVVLCPLLAVESLGDDAIDVSGFDWVIVTSPTGAGELRRRALGRPRRVAAIGQATADAWGAPVDLIAAVSTQEGLLAELPRPAGRVLFAGAEGARSLLARQLDAEVVRLYRTRPLRPQRLPDGDLVVLASPSAAQALAAVGTAVPAISIGPETTAAACEAGLAVLCEAPSHDLDGLVDAVAQVAR